MCPMIKLIAFKSFGVGNPVAILLVNRHRQAFTKEGLIALISQSNAADKKILKDILIQFDSFKYVELDELSDDDFSGQEKLL